MYWGAFAALVPPIKGALDADDGDFGLAMLGAAGGAVAAMSCAPLIERRLGTGALPLLAASMVLPLVAVALAPTLVLFAIAIAFAGASVGALDVVMNTHTSRNEQRVGQSLMNLNHAMFSLAYAAAASATGFARDAGHDALAVFPVCGFLSLMLIPGMIERRPLTTPVRTGGIGAGLRARSGRWWCWPV